MNSSQVDIAIVGGGFSAVALVSFLSQIPQSRTLRVAVFEEQNAPVGAGVAYRTNEEAHILNVVAERMSIDPKRPKHFLQWLDAKHPGRYHAHDYVPRRLYREYLEDVFKQASEQLSLRVVRQRVSQIKRQDNEMFELIGADGSSLCAHSVVLAMGNCLGGKPEYAPEGDTGSHSVSNARAAVINSWNTDWSSFQSARSVAIVGTGLTAMDAVLALEKNGYQGSYTLISRRGLLPRPQPEEHKTTALSDACVQEILAAGGKLRSALRIARKFVRSGNDWTTLFESLRPVSPQLWSNLTLAEQERFQRHYRPYWEVHRHRAPQSTLAVINSLTKQNRLTVIRGSFSDAHVVSDKGGDGEYNRIRVVLNKRSNTHPTEPQLYDAVFDCRGPWNSITATKDSLLDSLFGSGLAVVSENGLGLAVEDNCLLKNEDSAHAEALPLYALGALCRGQFGESSAARELRAQAVLVAQDVVARLESRAVSGSGDTNLGVGISSESQSRQHFDIVSV